MKFRRSLVRGFAPVAVFAVIGTGLVMSQTQSADVDVRATPAQVRQQAVTTTAAADRRTVEVARAEVHEDPVAHDVEDSDHTVLQRRAVVAELPQTDLKPFSMLGVTWKGGLDPAETVVQVRWRADGTWTDWSGVDVDPSDEGTPGTEPQWVDRADAAAVRVLSTADAKPTGVALSTIDPGKTPQVTAAASSVSQPKIISRSSWGASNAGSCDSPIYGSSTKGVVIHHTAGSNSYSASQSASIVKATQAYHTGSRKWCDIGYNFLVDKYGQIFEGRRGGITKSVRAAHSGNGPVNEQTAGISLMGTFDSTSPTSAMKTAVVKLAAWKMALHGIPAKGTYSLGGVTLNRIAGHRNVVSTACPGATVYSWLTSTSSTGLRQQVAAAMAATGPVAPAGLKSTERSQTSISMSWSPVSGAGGYRLFYGTRADGTGGATKVETTGTTATIKDLKPGTTYYVDVAALDSAGKSGTYTQRVAVATPLAAPVDFVAKATSGSSASVQWKPVAGASGYRFFSGLRADGTGGATKGETKQTSASITNLTPGTTYYVDVAALDSAGNSGTYTQRVAVSTPQLATPGGFAAKATSPTSISLSWDQVAGATGYRAWHGTSSTGSGATVHEQTGTSLIVKDLKPGTTYYVDVAALAGSSRSEYTSRIKISTLSASQTSKVPGDFSASAPSTSSAKASWSTVSGASRYRLWYGTNADGTGATKREVTTTSSTITGLKPGTTYYLSVAALNADGVPWEYTSRVAVKVPAAASGGTLDTPSNLRSDAVSSSSFTMKWDAVKGASGYRVWYGTSSAGSGALSKQVTSTSASITGVASSTAYYVDVAALKSDGSRGDYTSRVKVTTSAASSAGSSVTVPSSRVVAFKGHGYGHGIGMSQYGAEGGARDGNSYSTILSRYYPGTALSSKSATMRVLLSKDTTSDVVVASGSGIVLRKLSDGSTTSLPTKVGSDTVNRWSIGTYKSDAKQSDLWYRTGSSWKSYKSMRWTGDAQFESSSPLSLQLPNGTLAPYRGALRSARPSSGSTSRDTVNVLGLEDYTRGVVAREMPSSWHAEALKAQSVAARTYGVRLLSSSRYYDACDTTSCQVYGGVAAETSPSDAAVKATSGKILTYNGATALTQFSSSSGGTTAVGSQPYLKAVTDPWDGWSGNKNHSWTINVKASTIEKAYSSIGTLKSMKVTKRAGGGSYGGRVSSIVLTGSKKSVTITGNDARWGFGLRSNWFGF